MQQLVNCRQCGQPSYVNSQLGVDQACPGCGTILYSAPTASPVATPQPQHPGSAFGGPSQPMQPTPVSQPELQPLDDVPAEK